MRMRLEAKKDGRRKGRLIVQGFREPNEWVVGKNDSPVAALWTVRLLLFMAGCASDVVSSIDINTAFLQGGEFHDSDPDRYVYYQPYEEAEKIYYQLTGCLYGQRGASMAWYTTLKTWLCDPKGQGFVAGKNDPCMFVNPRTGLRLAIVVDGIICRGSKEATEMFYRDLGSRFDIKDTPYTGQLT